MEELNKGYEFTKAQIAELESLRAENERLKQIKSRNKSIDLLAENQSLKAELEAARKDAESWRSYKKRKDEVIAVGMGRNVLREAAIEQAKGAV